MIIFVTLILIIVILNLIFNKIKLVSKSNEVINKKLYCSIIFIIMSAILGLRNISIGIDTITYYYSFNNIKYLSLNDSISVKFEKGYKILEFCIGRVFGDFQILLILIAILYVGVVSYYIYKYSVNPMLSYIFFIIFDFYTFAMSANRQTIAISLVMISLKYAMDRKSIKFMILIILAASFHITALIFLPVYFVSKFKLNNKNIILFIFIGVAFLLLKNELQLYISKYSRIAYSFTDTGGRNMYIFMFISSILGIIYRKKSINLDSSNKYFFYMILISTIIMPITRFNPAVMRLYLYFFIFMIIYIPNIIYSINNRFIRISGVTGYLAVGIIWFFSSVIYTEQIERYLFFWQ